MAWLRIQSHEFKLLQVRFVGGGVSCVMASSDYELGQGVVEDPVSYDLTASISV